MSDPVYLDYQATTPLDQRVFDAMEPYFTHIFGNPHSRHHDYGLRASRAVSEARAQVADLIGAGDDDVVFTSGATESCNLAIRGIAAGMNSRNEVVTVATEHPAVLDTVRALASAGFVVHELPVHHPSGVVDLDVFREVVGPRTALVSVMLVNNETGVVQPLPEISDLAHAAGAVMHTDATQAPARIPVDVDDLGVDLLSCSSHKIYGPMGIGALYVRPDVAGRLSPIVTGGGQERGLRSGTVPLPLAVGFGAACMLAAECRPAEASRIGDFAGRLAIGLQATCPGFSRNGSAVSCAPGTLNFTVPGVPAEQVLPELSDRIAISTGSACSSEGADPSHVLLAHGLSPADALCSYRVSFGRFSRPDDVDAALAAFNGVLQPVGVMA